MKKIAVKSILLLFALTLVASIAVAGESAGEDSGWFDFENCVFCKTLAVEPGMLEHTVWENHKIANGSMNIMIVPAEYKEAMATAMSSMEATGKKMHSGEVNPMTAEMCGHCQAYGGLMMSGVNMESVEGEAATVTLMTSDDAAVVASIHDMVDKDNAAMAMMGGHEHGKGDHPKSDHPKGDKSSGDHPKG